MAIQVSKSMLKQQCYYIRFLGRTVESGNEMA